MSDDLTIAYMLGVEDMRSKLHKQADEIERLRAENEKFYKQAEMNARLLTENASLRAENETLRRDVKTAVMGDSAELQDVKRENEKLHREAAIRIDQIEREQEAHLRTIADYNRAAVKIEKLRKALKPFVKLQATFMASCNGAPDDYLIAENLSCGILRAAAAAIRECGE